MATKVSSNSTDPQLFYSLTPIVSPQHSPEPSPISQNKSSAAPHQFNIYFNSDTQSSLNALFQLTLNVTNLTKNNPNPLYTEFSNNSDFDKSAKSFALVKAYQERNAYDNEALKVVNTFSEKFIPYIKASGALIAVTFEDLSNNTQQKHSDNLTTQIKDIKIEDTDMKV